MSLQDKAACTELIQNWGFWRDQGRWADLSGTFHPDGRISVTWFSGPFAEFVEASKRSLGSPKSSSKHLIGLPMLKLSGVRAVAETNISILGRQDLGGILVDSVAHARFLDRLERRQDTSRQDTWRIVERIAVYEKDTLTAVKPDPAFDALMREVDFSRYPKACCFLAYRLERLGRTLADPIYCDGMPETDAVYLKYAHWLEGKS